MRSEEVLAWQSWTTEIWDWRGGGLEEIECGFALRIVDPEPEQLTLPRCSIHVLDRPLLFEVLGNGKIRTCKAHRAFVAFSFHETLFSAYVELSSGEWVFFLRTHTAVSARNRVEQSRWPILEAI